MFLFHLYQIPSYVISLQPSEVMRALRGDSTNVYFCAFILKLALEMSVLQCLIASDLGTEETGVFVCV